MGKGLLISKRVISIQLSKNNVLQGVISNALIHPIILSKEKNLIKQYQTLETNANTRKTNYYTYIA
jgi:hypothetical protein